MIVARRLSFFGDHAHLAKSPMLRSPSGATAQAEWVVYATRPFGWPEAMPAYLSLYTHRVAIANSRLIAFDQQGVTKGEQNCPPEIPRKPRDARAFSNVQRTADRGRIVAKRAISPDLITCL
ncbi:hypothetical protein XI09_20205 [Bradyrhizobium sp. CCBAU 11386]|nr:hypothetical protein [Bradyrhizobium sp. CCBAU 11386]